MLIHSIKLSISINIKDHSPPLHTTQCRSSPLQRLAPPLRKTVRYTLYSGFTKKVQIPLVLHPYLKTIEVVSPFRELTAVAFVHQVSLSLAQALR